MPYCKKCGCKMQDDDTFCPECGYGENKEVEGRKATNLKEMSVFWLCILQFLTLGVYNAVWFFKQKEGLNNLTSKEKLASSIITFLLIGQIISAILLIAGIPTAGSLNGGSVGGLDSIFSLVLIIVIWVQSFKVRRILEQHFKQELSGFATFFFTILYLQYKINKFIKKT